LAFDTARKVLLTASLGRLENSNGCEGTRAAFLLTLPAQQTSLIIPCNAKGRRGRSPCRVSVGPQGHD
jgi:hypothetical protein